MMLDPAILLVTILTAHGALPSQPYLVERRECPALAAAVHVNTGRPYLGWSVRAMCRAISVLPSAADVRGH